MLPRSAHRPRAPSRTPEPPNRDGPARVSAGVATSADPIAEPELLRRWVGDGEPTDRGDATGQAPVAGARDHEAQVRRLPRRRRRTHAALAPRSAVDPRSRARRCRRRTVLPESGLPLPAG